MTSIPQAPSGGSTSLTINAKSGEMVTLGSTGSTGVQTIQGNNVTLAGGPRSIPRLKSKKPHAAKREAPCSEKKCPEEEIAYCF